MKSRKYFWQFRKFSKTIVLLIIVLIITLRLEHYPQIAKAQTNADFDFLNTLGLPWRCNDTEPRVITKDWDDHWANSTATGIAIDFNRTGDGDYDKDVL